MFAASAPAAFRQLRYGMSRAHVLDVMFTSTDLVALMTACSGNVTEAAERAGIERQSFHRLLAKHNIRAQPFRRRGGSSIAQRALARLRER